MLPAPLMFDQDMTVFLESGRRRLKIIARIATIHRIVSKIGEQEQEINLYQHARAQRRV
jgi:hypothetical protein